jgi:two-component system chemotaxis response regulator CheB
MRKAGAVTMAQDEATSVVFGMPREALNIGAADDAVAIGDIGRRILAASGAYGHRV